MLPGPNDKCPCGSGKKFKRCCGLTLSAAPARSSSKALLDDLSDEPPEDLLAELAELGALFDGGLDDVSHPEPFWNDLIDELQEATPEETLVLAARAVEEAPRFHMDDGMELLHHAASAARESGQHRQFEQLLALVEQRRPEFAAEEVASLLQWRAECALALGGDPLPALLAFAGHAEQAGDELLGMLDRLAYHGLHAALAAASAAGFKRLKTVDVPAEESEAMREKAAGAVVDALFAEIPELRADHPALVEQLHPLGAVGADWVIELVEAKAGRGAKPVLEDFLGDTARRTSAVEALSAELYRKLVLSWKWPAARAELARLEVVDYLAGRGHSKAERKSLTRGGRKATPQERAFLMPDAASAGEHALILAESMCAHPAMAFVAALAPLAALLVDRGLGDAEGARRLAVELPGALVELPEYFSEDADSVALRKAFDGAMAGLAAKS